MNGNTSSVARNQRINLVKSAIQHKYQYIYENVQSPELIQELFSKGVLNLEDYDNLKQKHNNDGAIAQCKLMLDKILASEKVLQFMEIFAKKNEQIYQVINKEMAIIKANMDMTSPDMDEPIQLVEMKDGKLQVNPEAVSVLNDNQVPATVIAIVGKSRTGKSYFMNRLFNSNSGFELGNKVEPQTKGIWMWVKPHPLRKKTALVLLEMEGLSAFSQDDENLDRNLFCLALLTSKVMIYNVQNVLDVAILHEINFMSELTDYIKMKEKSEEDEKGDFALYFPHLCFLIRDFDKELIIGEEKITSNQYLEYALKEKENKYHKKSIDDFNRPRKCIKDFFPKCDCFTLCKPVDDEKLLHRIHTLKDDEFKEKFITSVNKATKTMLKFAEPQYITDEKMTSSRFMQLMITYVKCMNKGLIPCIHTAAEQLQEITFKQACTESEKIYLQKMNEYLQQHEPYPAATEQLQEFHKSAYDSAVKTYTRLVFASDKEDGDRKQEHLNNLIKKHQHFENENNNKSAKQCKMIIETCFKARMDKVKANVYYCEGGHDMFLQDTKQAEEKYNATLHKGPMSEKILNSFKKDCQKEIGSIIDIEKKIKQLNTLLENKLTETKQWRNETQDALNKQQRNSETKEAENIKLKEESLHNTQAWEQSEMKFRRQRATDKEEIERLNAEAAERARGPFTRFSSVLCGCNSQA